VVSQKGRGTSRPHAVWLALSVGVPPDVEVEQWPAEVIASPDPQLNKAIDIVMKQLKENPPQRRQRPPFPVPARQ